MKGFPKMLYTMLTWHPKPLPEEIDLSKQTAIITGANGGLGLEAAKDLAGRGIERIILCARTAQNEELARQQILQIHPSCIVELWIVDYENYESLLECGKKAANLSSLNITILNAGVRRLDYHATPNTGHEQNLQVNHLGTALLSVLLYPALLRSAEESKKPSRMTIVSSIVHWWTPFKEYHSDSSSILAQMDKEESMLNCPPHERYHTAKLLNVLWMRALAQKVDGNKVIVNAVNPGLCKSNLHRHEKSMIISTVTAIFAWTAAEGGHNISNAAVAQGVESHGQYLSEQVIKEPSDFVLSNQGNDAQTKVWQETVTLFEHEIPNFQIPAFD